MPTVKDLATQQNQPANTVLAGPTSGGPGAPSFRTLVTGDLATAKTLLNVRYLLQGTTTYTPTTGISAIYVEAVAAGGGGGGADTLAGNAAAGGGGASGGYSAVYLGNNLKSSYTVSVGSGGLGGLVGPNAGQNGGDTTFDSPSVCTAKGGGGGLGGTVSTTGLFIFGGAGILSGSVGDLTIAGSSGGLGIVLSGTVAASGRGANSYFGGGAIEQITDLAGNGGSLYGSGGSGGCVLNGGIGRAGGAGANGILRIWEFS